MGSPPYWKQSVVAVTEWWNSVKSARSVWRLTRLYTGLLLIVVSLLLVVLYQLSIGQMLRQQQLQMDQLINQQKLLAQQLDRKDFIAQFELQAASSRQFILTYQQHDRFIGHLDNLPTTLNHCPQLNRFPIWHDKYNQIRLISGCVQAIEDGMLIIGVDDEGLVKVREQFISAAMIALLLALMLGLFTGLIFSMRVLKRINGFNQTAQQVEAGQLSARMSISKHHDEYDDMATHINTMLSQLQHSFETIAGITDAIAHDLRTPLSHLRQQLEAQILVKQQQLAPCDELQDMLQKLDEILFTFSAMLELTRLQQQKEQKSQHFKQVVLQRVIVDALDLIEPLAEERQQQLSLNQAQPLSIQGDATLLFRAIYNLLENASKYAGEHAQISVALHGNGFSISDNGPGICDSEKEKVFQRLYRIEKSRGVSGYGLGLTLVKAIVQLHNGTIHLTDNNPGLKVEVLFDSQ